MDPLNGEFIASASTRSIGSPPTQVANLTILSLCSRDHLGSVSSCCRHFDSCPQLKLRGRSYVPPRTPYLTGGPASHEGQSENSDENELAGSKPTWPRLVATREDSWVLRTIGETYQYGLQSKEYHSLIHGIGASLVSRGGEKLSPPTHDECTDTGSQKPKCVNLDPLALNA